MADYYTLLTNAGIAYETACKAAGTPIKLSQISVGDGGGAVYNPAATDTALKREVWRGPLNALFQDEKNPSWLLAEVTIPPDVGGWYVREAGIWTDTGILYAIVKYPESFKPVLATSGSGKEFYIRSIFETSNASLVTLLIDDTVVKTTRAWVMGYLADELAKLDGKQSVRVATTENIVLSGAQQIDGVAVLSGQRVLAVAQTAAKDNGIYVAANGAWVRSVDANTSARVTPGLTVMVEEGTANADSLWHLVTNGPITLGTTSLSFEMLAGRTGIQAGTYKSLTVDKYGRATAGANPETLAGFGIKDTYTKAEIEAMIAQASALPVGSMVGFPLNKIAPGFLEIDGSVKSIATYPDLAAFLGAAFNQGNEGAGNFRLPESRGEFLRGWDHGRGVDAGRVIGSYQLDEVRAHTHQIALIQTTATAGTGQGAPNGGGVNDNSTIRSTGGAETRPRNLAVLWCIKAWNAPINQGSIDIAALQALAVQATEINRGTAKIATQAFTDAGADDTTIVTPKKLCWGFQILKAANGYVVFPTWLGGLIIQWGYSMIPSGATVVPFPLSYPNACFGIQATPFNVTGAADVIEYTALPTKTGFTAVGVSSGITGAPAQTATNFYWFSIGY
ncbi:phage tail-collar fiber domain-containing protein [Pseudomonas arsenicoxydans]|uniref:Phage tail protein n=1 Tax=Pseudomonas arsenicoxydans TaxID=702115 RepID=A0A4P6GED1_9PSED|nr:phage tail protein [Pseudomonas arsenicoxydans]QAY88000.1 phage tail protein [Pseudomonas arsenicoxydans]